MARPFQHLQIPSNSGKVALFVLNLFISMHPVSAQEPVAFSATEVTVAQRTMIQKLSGGLPIKDDIYLKSRSTARERQQAANYLYSAFANEGMVPQAHKYKVSNQLAVLDLFFDPFMGTNVYTLLPATNGSKEYVILGAHYDSEPGSPGANDNGTGVALIFQVARHLKQLKHRDKNFIVVFFDQEEDHLVGSRAFAEKLKKEGLCINSVHTADMTGWDADGDRAVELEYPSAALHSLYAEAGEKLGIPLHKTLVNSSDHASFREAGFQAVGIAEEYANGDTTPHYHQATDTEATVNYGFLVSTTQLVWEVMKQLAATTTQENL